MTAAVRYGDYGGDYNVLIFTVELFAIHNLFYQGAYKEVLDQSLAGYSDSAITQARVYQYRAQIALGSPEQVVADLEDTEGNAALAAVKALALYKAGEIEGSLEIVEELVETSSDDATVQVLCATVLYLAERVEDALSLLSKHEGNLAAVALIVQIRLMQNKLNLAAKEVQHVKKWGQDNLLVNLSEAWVDLHLGGDKYQEAFYIYEELAQTPSTSNARTFVGQAVADIQLGRLEEAEDAINSALERDSTSADVLVNAIILYILLGRDYSQQLETLQSVDAENPFLTDLEEKSGLFDSCAAEYASLIVE
ncbi:coatomer epsilon subunit-domain-containing protein [Lipomyces kononenkoae]|uniref:Coatomer epsilon subunit-domain-containing protein n=1 Tax=Lipomyces kononenkoae TaxID=34357 RepID=A0ACC3SZ49_LIPKO